MGDPDLEETPVHPFEEDLARTALAAVATFLLANSIHAHSWVELFVYYFAKEAGA